MNLQPELTGRCRNAQPDPAIAKRAAYGRERSELVRGTLHACLRDHDFHPADDHAHPGTNSRAIVWVLVDTVSQFRQRYVVEVPKGKSEYALDSVTMEDVKEFSQKHLGETIVSHRVISEKDALDLFDEDNDYLKSWNEEKKLSYINKIDYSK
jgi:hypothetical protein